MTSPYTNDETDLEITHADGFDTTVDTVMSCDAFGNFKAEQVEIRKPRP